MRQSVEPKHRRYVKGYGFLSFANKYGKKMTNAGIKAGKKITESKNTCDFAKTTGKKIISKTAEATGDLVGSKIADKTTSMKKHPSGHSISEKERQIDETDDVFIPPEKRALIIKDLRHSNATYKMEYKKIAKLISYDE